MMESAALANVTRKDPLISAETARYFASPVLNASSKIPHLLLGEYARALFELAVERCHGAIAKISRHILPQFSNIIANALPWSTAWHPDLAKLERLLVRPTDEIAFWNALAPMVVRLGSEGVLTEGDIQLQVPQKLFWGNLKLPEADRVIFRRDSVRAAIRLFRTATHITTIYARQSPDGLWATPDASHIGIIWIGEHPVPLWTPQDGNPYPIPAERAAGPNALAQAGSTILDAVDLLGQYSPEFISWIADGMRIIIPLDASGGRRMSASVEEFPGLTFLSFPAPAAETAETLAHEASHHHFLALQRLTALHDGTDENEYYSPIDDCSRGIDVILYTFHAFANAALYHRSLVRAGRTEYYRLNGRTLDESLDRIRVLHGYLGQTRALTEAGETLWKPLATALFDG